MTLGERLREARTYQDLTQTEVAKKTGINNKTLSNWENDVSKPSPEDLLMLSKIYGTTLDYLFGVSETPKGTLIPPGKTPGQIILGDKYQPSQKVSQEAIIHSYKIPILGRVAAGIPIEAHEEILGYQYINEEYRNDGYSYFALRICGKSMEPTIMDGDIVIVRQQATVDSGDIAIVLIDGEDATAKEVKESPEGITLIGHNVAVYTPHFYSNKDIQELPVQIIGKVIQAIRKF